MAKKATKKLLSGEGWTFEPAAAAGAEDVVSLPDGEQRVKIRLEKRARGKETTTVSGFVLSVADQRALCASLKKSCGAGGSVTASGMEIQGDARERIRVFLAAKGWQTHIC